MRRITIDEVRAACEATGYRLERYITLSNTMKCGCPIGILSKYQRKEEFFIYQAIQNIGLDHSYGRGVVAGFDDRGNPGIDLGNEFTAGLDDGTAIRQALLPA